MKTSILLEQHAAAGARLTLGPFGETLLTFGDVPAEYGAATRAAMVFDQTDRGQLRVSGKDATDFLHRITANRIKGLAPGTGNANLLLTGKGKLVEMFDLLFVGEEAGYLLSTPPGRAASLKTALDMYLFTEDVQLDDETDSYAPLALIGPEANAVVERALAALGFEGTTGLQELEPHACIEVESSSAIRALRISAISTAGRAGLRLKALGASTGASAQSSANSAASEGTEAQPDVSTATLALWQALVDAGARPGGLALFDILRTEAAVAAFGVDIDDTVYPQEARLEHAFSLEKGCYIGQEVVAKIDTYGGLNKRLFALKTGEESTPRGTRLWREDPERGWRDLGVITSWAWSFALGTGLALAYVKRRHQEPGCEFHLAPAGADPEAIAAAPTATLVETPLEPAANPA